MSRNLVPQNKQCIQYTTEDSISNIREFVNPNYILAWIKGKTLFIRQALATSTNLLVRPTDWVFKTPRGNIYVMTDKKYKATFVELVEYKDTVEVIKVRKNGKRPARRRPLE